MAIYRGPGGAGDATNDATSQAILAAASAVAAANSEAAAAASAVTAANSATSATSSANNAANSATNAADSATNAANSATSAASSASTATTKASEASMSATNAASSASAAATSASNASTLATSASNSATSASTSATNAANSATAAANSSISAAGSASDAAGSATSAASSASEAAGYAASINPADLVHISGTETITGSKTFSTNPTISSGTANGVAYLNGSKVLTTGSALVFDGSNLGLGVTPSVSTSSGIIQNRGGILYAYDGTFQDLTQNAYYNSGYKYTVSGAPASMLRQQVGTFAFFTAPSGTAGNAISFTQAMTLNASGNLIIGGTTANQKLQVTGAGPVGIRILDTNTNSWDIVNNSYLSFTRGSTETMRIDSSGNLLVGTTSASGRLTINPASNAQYGAWIASQSAGDVGNAMLVLAKYDNNTTTSQIFAQFRVNSSTLSGYITANGANAATFTSSSDARLKENVGKLPNQLDNICLLNPVEFDFKDGSGHQIGFIAQEMQNVYSDAVAEGPDGYLMISGWSKTEARLVKAIQELKAELDATKAEVAALKGN